MHPHLHARNQPDRPAVVMAESGETITYGELEMRANQGAQLFRALGLRSGDVIALFLENHPRYLEICWAAQRAGLYYTCISSALTAGEVDYILRDCGARLFITSPARAPVVEKLAPQLGDVHLFTIDAAHGPFAHFEAARAAMPTALIADPGPGRDMLYSSGTTGRPKGVKAPMTDEPFDADNALAALSRALYGFNTETIYLSPAPLYHAAPLRFCMSVHRMGGTTVIMEKFDPEAALRLIEQHRITHSQWVPTHFVRLLKLPEDVRSKYDHSSLVCAIHAAAPCPTQVKRDMIGWWGPVLREYYGGTEGNGLTAISSQEWLKKPGSVGKAILGQLKICDEHGEEVGPNVDGTVYFAGGPEFVYHQDPDKTAQSRNKHGWTTLGDVGHVDEDGQSSQGRRRRGDRRARSGDGRESGGGRATRELERGRTGIARRARSLRARQHLALEGAETDRLPPRIAALGDRKTVQASAARRILGRQDAGGVSLSRRRSPCGTATQRRNNRPRRSRASRPSTARPE